MLASVSRRVAELPGISGIVSAFIRWIFRQFSQSSIHGFAILTDVRHVSPVGVLERLEATLQLLEQVDPRRCRRIRAEVPRILVGEVRPNRAYSVAHGPAMIIDREAILEGSLAMLASVVVHEGAHARISRRGIRYTRHNRPRIEQRCCAEQIDFLMRLPSEHTADAQSIIAELQVALKSPTPWYRQAEIDRSKALARQRRRARRAEPKAPDA